MTCEVALMGMLEVAVPFWVVRWRERGPQSNWRERAQELSQVVAEKGDVLQYRSKKGESANAFNALAEAVALLSFVPGGVRFNGLRWTSTWDGEGLAGITCKQENP